MWVEEGRMARELPVHSRVRQRSTCSTYSVYVALAVWWRSGWECSGATVLGALPCSCITCASNSSTLTRDTKEHNKDTGHERTTTENRASAVDELVRARAWGARVPVEAWAGHLQLVAVACRDCSRRHDAKSAAGRSLRRRKVP